MMTGIDLVHYLHIVAFAVIVGLELPVLYAVRLSRRTDVSADAQALVAQVRRWSYAVSGLLLVTFLPFGVSIAIDIGVYTLMSPRWLTATWSVALAWLLIVLIAEVSGNAAFARRTYTTEIVLRFIIGLGHVYDGIVGFLGTGMIQTNWLAAKVVLFGLMLMVSSLLRWQTRPLRFYKASDGAVEAEVLSAAHVKWGSYAIVAMALMAAWMGAIKPEIKPW
ncbi:MAG: hypothetical protein RIC29_17720 [Rhodospirillaceae bacterium]